MNAAARTDPETPGVNNTVTIIDPNILGIDNAVWIREEGIYFGDTIAFEQLREKLPVLGYIVQDTRDAMRGHHVQASDEFLLWGIASPAFSTWSIQSMMEPEIPYGFPENAWLMTQLSVRP